MKKVIEKQNRHRGDFSGVGDIHFFYSADEVLYGALPEFEDAYKPATLRIRMQLTAVLSAVRA